VDGASGEDPLREPTHDDGFACDGRVRQSDMRAGTQRMVRVARVQACTSHTCMLPTTCKTMHIPDVIVSRCEVIVPVPASRTVPACMSAICGVR